MEWRNFAEELTVECAIAFAALDVRGGSWLDVQPLHFFVYANDAPS
jgi:hypothetical protein